MKIEPKELNTVNCTNTNRIRFWSKGEIVELEHSTVQNYRNLQVVTFSLLISEWTIAK